MDAINLADLKDNLSALIDRVEAGESVDITLDGRPFARITPAPPIVPFTPIDIAPLRALAATLPFDASAAGGLVRRMRDDSRY